MEIFADNLVGVPDNIRYDGEQHYWIAFSTVIYLLTFADYVSICVRLMSSKTISIFP